MRIEASIHVEAPAETVWHIATDPKLAPRWNPNIVSIDYDGDGPIHEGSTWLQVLRVMGKEERMTGTVVECEPPHHGVVSFTGTGSPRVTTTVADQSDGVTLTQTMDLRIPAGLTGAAMRLGAPLIREQLNQALRRQKQAAEQETSSREGG